MALSCPTPKHCEYGRKMASSSLGSARNPTPVSEIQLLQPFKTARLNQAGGKNKLCHSCGVTATLATKNHKALYNLLQDQEVACSLKPPPRSCKLWWPGPVARSRWPGPSRARSRWPGPVARSRWPGPSLCPGTPAYCHSVRTPHVIKKNNCFFVQWGRAIATETLNEMEEVGFLWQRNWLKMGGGYPRPSHNWESEGG